MPEGVPGRLPAAFALCVVLALGGCARGDADATVRSDSATPEAEAPLTTRTSVTDSDGRTVDLTVPVRRVVSLVPSATLTLAALGARDAVVARTDFDTASWAADLPSVGGGLEPSIEAIVAARPDLVIRFGGPQDVRTPSRLDDLGIPHIAIRPDGIDDVMETVRLLGRITGHPAEADSVDAAIGAVLDSVRAAARGRAPVRVAYVLGGEPPWVSGPGTYLDELIRLAGGVNVFADLGALYSSVSPEEFVARDIDVILLSEGATFDRSLAHGARIREVGSWVEVPGPAVADAARTISGLLRDGGRP